MSKILITGAAGFIGSHLQDAFINLGHEVISVDNLSGGFKRNINPKAIFYKTDLKDKKEVDFIFKHHTPDVVFHLAADATEGRSQFTPISATENNLLISVNTFTAAIKYGVKRVVFTSSMSVYGDQVPPFNEEMSTRPVDVYGVNKAAIEKILSILSSVYGFEYVILRPHNVFGERQNIRDAYRNVVGIFMNRIMKGEPIYVYGDGEQVRSFTHIDNAIPCFVKALDAPVSGEIINVGPTETQTINLLAKTVMRALNKEVEIKYLPDRPLEVKYAHCTDHKETQLLGYRKAISFDGGIDRMAKWAQQLGSQDFVYLDDLEIVNESTPLTWRKKL